MSMFGHLSREEIEGLLLKFVLATPPPRPSTAEEGTSQKSAAERACSPMSTVTTSDSDPPGLGIEDLNNILDRPHEIPTTIPTFTNTKLGHTQWHASDTLDSNEQSMSTFSIKPADLKPALYFQQYKKYKLYKHHGGKRFLRDFVQPTTISVLHHFFLEVSPTTTPDHFLTLAPDSDIIKAIMYYLQHSCEEDLAPAKLLQQYSISKLPITLDAVQEYTALFADSLIDFNSILSTVSENQILKFFYRGLPESIAKYMEHTLVLSKFTQAKNYVFTKLHSKIALFDKSKTSTTVPHHQSTKSINPHQRQLKIPTSVHSSSPWGVPNIPPADIPALESRYIAKDSKIKYPYQEPCLNCGLDDHKYWNCAKVCRFCSTPHQIERATKCKGYALGKWEAYICWEYSQKTDNKVCNSIPTISHPVANYTSAAAPPTSTVKDATFVLDTAATPIYANDITFFDTPPTTETETVMLADGQSISSIARGKIAGQSALYTPTFPRNLVPLTSLLHSNRAAIFTGNTFSILDGTANPIVTALINNTQPYQLYTSTTSTGIHTLSSHDTLRLLQNTPSQASAVYYKSAKLVNNAETVRFLHELLGHADRQTVESVISNNLIQGIPGDITIDHIRKHWPTCPACAIGSLSQKAHSTEISTTEYKPGEKLVIDIKQWSSTKAYPPTINGGQYTVTAICAATDYVIAHIIKSRRLLPQSLQAIVDYIASKGHHVKIIQVDNEYAENSQVQQICQRHNIQLRAGIPHEHFQQGKVERFHRSVQDAVQKFFAEKPHLPQRLWGPAYSHYVDIHNNLPRRLHPTTTPHSAFGGELLNLEHTPILPWGTLVIAHIPLPLQTTSSGRGVPAYFVGRAPNYNDGIQLYRPDTKSIIIRRTYKIMGPDPIQPLLSNIIAPTLLCVPNAGTNDEQSPTLTSTEMEDDITPDEALEQNSELYEYTELIKTDVHHTQRSYFDHIGRKFRDTDEQCDYYIDGIYKIKNAAHSTLLFRLRPTNIENPAWHDYEYQECKDLLHANYISWYSEARLSITTPHTYTQVLKHTDKDKFIDATNTEINRWNQLDVYTPVPTNLQSNISKQDIGQLRTLYTVKRKADSTYDKHKCRIYYDGKGWPLQNLDTDTYAGVASRETTRVILTIAAIENNDLWGFDITSFFLYTRIPSTAKPVYARRPPGLPNTLLPDLMRLNSYVYGHPEANKAATEMLAQSLIEFGFRASAVDPHLYILHDPSHADYCLISTHVDDGVGMSKPTSTIRNRVFAALREKFDITVEDELTNTLGMSITRNRDLCTLDLKMTKALESAFKKFPSAVTNTPPPTPIILDTDPQVSEYHNEYLNEADATTFREIIGTCNWIQACRYDIAFAVNTLARNMVSPTKTNLLQAYRVLQYLYGTKDLPLRIGGPDAHLTLYATVDSSYANHKDLKSHTGATFHISSTGAPVQILTKKQSITADSSTVAETIGIHYSTKNILWYRSLLANIGYTVTAPSLIFSDNQSTIKIINNKGSTGRTKHIELRYLVVREYIDSKFLQLEYLPTTDMVADMFTKVVSIPIFQKFRDQVLGLSPYNLPVTSTFQLPIYQSNG